METSIPNTNIILTEEDIKKAGNAVKAVKRSLPCDVWLTAVQVMAYTDDPAVAWVSKRLNFMVGSRFGDVFTERIYPTVIKVYTPKQKA